MDEDAIRREATKFALKNAIDYGKAEAGAVMNKVLASDPSLRSQVREISKIVKSAVDEVNRLSADERKKRFSSHAQEFKRIEKEKEEKSARPRMMLEGAVVGEFVTRFPPGPNGYMHVGHAKAAFLGRQFADIYEGKVFLYFDDTNPEKDKQEYVDAFHKDLEWLGLRFEDEYYASDHIEQMYEYAKKLILIGKAYACSCTKEEMGENRFNGIECKHRSHTKEQNAKEFVNMLSGKYNEGEMIIRFLGDMKASNTVLRDPTLLRVKRASHYRQGKKYIVWPTYDLNTAIVDSLHGITDILRSKEFELRDELGRKLLQALDLRVPRVHSFSRLTISGNVTHKSELRKLIAEGRLSGWDDPRLVTIAGLRRRGIQPGAIKEFALRAGMSKMDGALDMSMLLAANRAVVDPIARRLFLVEDPVELEIAGVPKDLKKVRLAFHPQRDMGGRECSVSNRLLIGGNDAKSLKIGSRVRLKDLFNIHVERHGKTIEARYAGNDNIDAAKIQWVDAKNNVECRLVYINALLVNGKFNHDSIVVKDGFAEQYVEQIQENEIVQFERVGFFKLDDSKKNSFIAV